MQKVSLVHGLSLIILHTVICFACRFRWRLSQLFYNVFWAVLPCWWRFDFFKYLKRWITSRGCWKKWWDNVQGLFCKLQWNHYPPPPHSTTPRPPTYPPCGHIIIMATLICPVTVRLLSVIGPSWQSWTFRLQENNNTFQESWQWANQQFVKKTISYCQQKIYIVIANVFQESKMFHHTMFSIWNL